MNECGDGAKVAQQQFLVADNGAIPVSPHQLLYKRISRCLALSFLITHHYLHRQAPVSFAFGAFFKGRLVGAMTIGKPASHTLIDGVAGKNNSKRVFELNRLCFLDFIVKNSESNFIGWCLRQMPKNIILVSYADTKFNHKGVVYQATNWKYTGTSIPFIDYTKNGKDHRSIPKFFRKNKALMQKVERSIKHRYVIFLNNDYSSLKWKVSSYP